MTATCNCKRCGKLCRTAEQTSDGSDLIRPSTKPLGCCADCAITCFIKTSVLKDVVDGKWAAPGFDVGRALRLPHIRAQFDTVFRSAGCADVSEVIDWEQVIANWDLAIPSGWDWKGQLYMVTKQRGTAHDGRV